MSPPKHLSSEERRAITVDTVIELAAQQNPNDISTTDIAKHMGVTQGALFKHFSTKESILQAVMEWVAERLLSRIEHAAAQAKTPLEALEAIFNANIAFIVEHPGAPRMMLGELQRSGQTAPKRLIKTIITQYKEHLQKILIEGKLQQQLTPNLDIETAATLFIGTIQGLVVQSLLSENMQQLRILAPSVFEIYLRGIKV